VLVTSSLSERNASKLIEEGAVGCFEKGSMTQEKLKNAISGILKKRLLFAEHEPAVFIVDWSVPDTGRLELCRRTHRGFYVPHGNVV
jgi:hypothetical protein